MPSEVDAWLAKYDNPQKPLLMAVRKAVLAADRRIGETIKWQAPTFVYKGNLASFYPKSKAHVSLMFHNGAQIPGNFPSLEGSGDVSRVMKFTSVDDLKAKSAELKRLVRAWCDRRDA
jgi:hypothetical protein